jgi:hypothetical protein
MKRQEIVEAPGRLGQLGPSGRVRDNDDNDNTIAVTLCSGFATAPAMLVENM